MEFTKNGQNMKKNEFKKKRKRKKIIFVRF